MSQSAVPYLVVGKNGANSLSAPTNAITSSSSITLGDVYFIDADGGANNGNILDAAALASVNKFIVVKTFLDQEGNLQKAYSNPITKSFVKKSTKDAYTAPVQQVTYLGYDGVTAGAIYDLAVTNNNVYRMNFTIKSDNSISQYHQPFGPVFSALTGFASTTPTISEKLTYLWQFVKVFNGDSTQSNTFAGTKRKTSISSYAFAEMLTDAVGTAFTNAVTITSGDTLLTSTAHGRVVGDFIRIGTTAATVTTNGVYRVASIVDANTLVLESPYRGSTLTAVVGGAAHSLITNLRVGIKITGKDQVFQRYSQKMFVRFLAGFLLDDTTRNSTSGGSQFAVTTTQGVYGSGTYEHILEKEISYFGYNGMSNYHTIPAIYSEPKTYATAGLTYDVYSIEYNEFGEDDFDVSKKLKVVELALVNGSAQNTAIGLVVAALPNYVSLA